MARKPTVKTTLEGLEEALVGLDNISIVAENEVAAVIEVVSIGIEAVMNLKVPMGATGRLKGSIRRRGVGRLPSGDVRAQVIVGEGLGGMMSRGALIPYAVFVEYGTKRGASAVSFAKKSASQGRKQMRSIAGRRIGKEINRIKIGRQRKRRRIR
jgi:hypothetical protein